MTKQILVSVVMSTCNTPKEYLLLAVESILKQTHKDIELIVIVDGGKYDNCLSKIHDERMNVIIHKKSMGLASRLNEGLALAKGEFIARMDTDDYALPDRLERQVNFMMKHPNLDICSMFAKEFGDSRRIRLNATTDNQHIKPELFLNNIIIHPTVMFRCSSVKKYNIKYNEGFDCAQDYELWSRLSDRCTFGVLPKVGLFYRVHNGQVSSKRHNRQFDFANKTILLNLERLSLDKENLNFVNILNGYSPMTSVGILDDFINTCLQKNSVNLMYNRESFKDVFYRHLFIRCLKKKMILDGVRFMRWYDCKYIIRKNILLLKCTIQLRKYCNLYSGLLNTYGGVKK